MEKDFFNPILDTFENEDLKEFANLCLDTIPLYYWQVGASSTGKYHPQYALGDHGLARHTWALCRFMNYLFSLDCIRKMFNSRERDLMRIAGMMHDTRKSGSQKEFENSKWTKFDHPILSSNEIAKVWNNYDGKTIDIEEINIIRRAIESHMGQWNVDKRNTNIELPKPEDKYQILVHVCDYLASRKDIEILFDDVQKNNQESLPDVNTWKLPFGKYEGMTLVEVKNINPGYIKWAKDNANSEPFHTLVMQL